MCRAKLMPLFSHLLDGSEHAELHPYYTGPFEWFEETEIEEVVWDIAPTLRILPPPPAHVIEIGAGRGRVTLHLARAGYMVTAVESSSIAAQRLRELLAANKLSHCVRVVESDFSRFRSAEPAEVCLLANLSINLFSADEVLELLESVTRNVKPGGLFCCGVFAPESRQILERYDGSADNSFHVQRYCDEEGVERLMLMQIEYDRTAARLRQNWLVDLFGSAKYKHRYHLASLEEFIWSEESLVPLLRQQGFEVEAQEPAQIAGGGANKQAVSFLRCCQSGDTGLAPRMSRLVPADEALPDAQAALIL